jgi:transposase
MTIPSSVACEIVRLFAVEGWRVGTIARHLGVHHSVVSRVLAGHGVTRDEVRRRSMVDRFEAFIRETFERYPRVPASVVYQMVRARGYEGGEDHFRHRVAGMRPRRAAEAFLELRTLPGEQAQVDWASFGRYPVEGGERRLSAFLMVLSYSRMLFVRFFLDQRMGSFLEGHVRAFTFFGGVARTLLYDNLKSAVLEREGLAIRFHRSLLELANHYHFEPRPVAPGRGNEKGRVERAIGYLRTSFFSAVSFTDVDDLNLQAERFCAEVARLRRWPQQRDVRVADAFTKEQPALVPLPGDCFPAEDVVEVTVGKTPYVHFDSNRYSVPHDRVRRQLTVRASSVRVRVIDRNEVVAEHRRCWAKQQVVEDPQHVAALVRAKHQARRHRGQDRLLRVVPGCEALLSEMAKRQRRLGSAVDWLNHLLDQFGRQELAIAVEEALTTGSPSVSTVHLVLDRRRHARNQRPVVPVTLPDRPEVRNLTVIPQDLAEYDPEEADHD